MIDVQNQVQYFCSHVLVYGKIQKQRRKGPRKLQIIDTFRDPSDIACHEALPLTVAGRIEVGEFDHLTAPSVIHRGLRAPSSVSRNLLLGFGGTIVLHGLAVGFFIPNQLMHKTPPPDPAGATVVQTLTVPTDDLILINVYQPTQRENDPVATPVDLRSELAKLAIPLAIADQVPDFNLPSSDSDSEKSAQSVAEPGNAELRARMFGLYMGQISARIERAWEKPSSSVNELRAGRSGDTFDADTFVCQVQILQDNQGNVQEVLLLACNGTEAWQHSLIVAINQSSPLPAPPMPGVFQRALTMTFAGQEDRGDRSASTRE
jgi:TonB C terminal